MFVFVCQLKVSHTDTDPDWRVVLLSFYFYVYSVLGFCICVFCAHFPYFVFVFVCQLKVSHTDSDQDWHVVLTESSLSKRLNSPKTHCEQLWPSDSKGCPRKRLNYRVTNDYPKQHQLVSQVAFLIHKVFVTFLLPSQMWSTSTPHVFVFVFVFGTNWSAKWYFSFARFCCDLSLLPPNSP